MLSLRAFLPSDDAALISWLRTPEELMLFTGPKLTWPLTTEQLDELREDPQFIQFTALDEAGEVVGHIELVDTGDASARVARVLVDPAQRGRGLGEQLVRAVIAEAEARDIRSLSLFVLPENARAIALYEKLNFTHAGASAQLTGALLMERSANPTPSPS